MCGTQSFGLGLLAGKCQTLTKFRLSKIRTNLLGATILRLHTHTCFAIDTLALTVKCMFLRVVIMKNNNMAKGKIVGELLPRASSNKTLLKRTRHPGTQIPAQLPRAWQSLQLKIFGFSTIEKHLRFV